MTAQLHKTRIFGTYENGRIDGWGWFWRIAPRVGGMGRGRTGDDCGGSKGVEETLRFEKESVFDISDTVERLSEFM